MKAAGETVYTMTTNSDCYRNIYHGEYLQCQDTSDVLEPLVSWLSEWWHGGNAENEGSVWGDLVCSNSCQNYDSYTYDYGTGECACTGNDRNIVWTSSMMWRR
ncbi:MAG: hypothetical protein ABH859_02540 [Pseudomonadota bacterium]